MADRISTEQQKVDRDKFSEGYELAFGGWKPCKSNKEKFDSTEWWDSGSLEFRKFNGKWYWRPMEDAINDYTTSKAGSIE